MAELDKIQVSVKYMLSWADCISDVMKAVIKNEAV